MPLEMCCRQVSRDIYCIFSLCYSLNCWRCYKSWGTGFQSLLLAVQVLTLLAPKAKHNLWHTKSIQLTKKNIYLVKCFLYSLRAPIWHCLERYKSLQFRPFPLLLQSFMVHPHLSVVYASPAASNRAYSRHVWYLSELMLSHRGIFALRFHRHQLHESVRGLTTACRRSCTIAIGSQKSSWGNHDIKFYIASRIVALS